MSNLQRILKMATQALDKTGQSSGTAPTGKTDWRDLVRTAADKVTGDSRPTQAPQQRSAAAPTTAADQAALARYDYLLETARPDQLEQAHREAFAKLTPAQRDLVAARLRESLPANEQPVSDSPDDLARAAARGEAQHPGFLRSTFAKAGGFGVGAVAGAGLGAAGGLLAMVAGGAIVSSVAAPLLEQAAGLGVDFDQFGDVTGGLEDQISEFGSGFELPGVFGLGGIFDRD